jgi:penicillin amidase
VRALARAVREHGDPAGGGWRWSGIQRARIPHLLGLPAFAAPTVPVQGGPSTLNPTGGQFGASWRMVVELGDEVRGWAVYPGGQSGNPLSTRYLDRLDAWTKGQLDTLIVPRDTRALSGASVHGRIRLRPQ